MRVHGPACPARPREAGGGRAGCLTTSRKPETADVELKDRGPEVQKRHGSGSRRRRPAHLPMLTPWRGGARKGRPFGRHSADVFRKKKLRTEGRA